jgi:hypothetical protein
MVVDAGRVRRVEARFRGVDGRVVVLRVAALRVDDARRFAVPAVFLVLLAARRVRDAARRVVLDARRDVEETRDWAT